MKYGKDHKDHTKQSGEHQLRSEGFVPRLDDEGNHIVQQYPKRDLYHWVNPTTTQRATVSVEVRTERAVVSYSMLTKQRAKRRTAGEIRRANYVQFD